MKLYRWSFFICSLVFPFGACRAQAGIPIPFAHAHNDYEHQRPLFDALAQGFTSIEADVFAIDGELFVYHDRPVDPDPDRSLKRLYLEPLRQLAAAYDGHIYPGYTGHFQLMIDIKTEAEPTYALIRDQLREYADLFQRIENGREISGPVMVFLSGNRPIATILAATTHIAKLDGRPGDLGQGYPSGKMPVISEHYGKVVDWDGRTKISRQQKKQLKALIKAVHREDKQLRLWAMPENEMAWQTFLKLGMDWINADDLARLRAFSVR